MSEKRFVVDYEVGVLDTKTNEIICDTVNAEKVVDLLNEQQSTIKHLEEYCGDLEADVKRLMKENEQLRQTMQKVCELLEEEVDLFSDEATEHDIIAYSEMQKFDNKDAYYICTATKKAIQMLKGRDRDE